MDEGFYLSLPSNSSMEYFEDNKVNNFVTKLPQSIELTGNWEVGLVDIQFPVNWTNLTKAQGKVLISLYNERHEAIDLFGVELEGGYYGSGEDLVQGLNLLLKRRKMAKRVNFKYDAFSNKISVTTRLAVAVATPWLAEMMGFEDIMLNPLNTNADADCEVEHSVQDLTATRPVDIKRGINSLYVYTDIVQERIVGHTMVPLLRSVPAHGSRGDITYHEVIRVHYIPVQKKYFHTIHIYITDDTGAFIPFQSGRSVVTLHFRQKWGLFLITNLVAITMTIIWNKWVMEVHPFTVDSGFKGAQG